MDEVFHVQNTFERSFTKSIPTREDERNKEAVVKEVLYFVSDFAAFSPWIGPASLAWVTRCRSRGQERLALENWGLGALGCSGEWWAQVRYHRGSPKLQG